MSEEEREKWFRMPETILAASSSELYLDDLFMETRNCPPKYLSFSSLKNSH